MSVLINTKPDTRIGNWLKEAMLVNNMSTEDVARKCKCSRQCVNNHIRTGKIQYIWCIVYGQLFDIDPDILWNLQKEG